MRGPPIKEEPKPEIPPEQAIRKVLLYTIAMFVQILRNCGKMQKKTLNPIFLFILQNGAILH